ncbi:hypothetical protein F4809DRAFT_595019 [Biscogniauxia mediterranea]|nr:hypothetical protein F4809DRAFT_595019 [Biscogniauxia mediterranea]
MRVIPVLAALVGTSSASTMFVQMTAAQMNYQWAVTGWSAGCAEAGCSYDFNITGTANETARPARPGFKAYCSGEGEGVPYQECTRLDSDDKPLRVVASLLSSNATTNGTRQAHIEVSMMHADPEAPTTFYNYTGDGYGTYNKFAAPVENFPIQVDSFFGVA